jgi:hypothetical protein
MELIVYFISSILVFNILIWRHNEVSRERECTKKYHLSIDELLRFDRICLVEIRISVIVYVMITAFFAAISLLSNEDQIKELQSLMAIILVIYWGLLCRHYILLKKEIDAREDKINLYKTLRNYRLLIGQDFSESGSYSSKISLSEFLSDVYRNQYLRELGTSGLEGDKNTFENFLYKLCYMMEEIAYSDQDPLPREYRYIIKMIVKSFNEKKSNMFDVLAEAPIISRKIVIEKLVNS